MQCLFTILLIFLLPSLRVLSYRNKSVWCCSILVLSLYQSTRIAIHGFQPQPQQQFWYSSTISTTARIDLRRIKHTKQYYSTQQRLLQQQHIETTTSTENKKLLHNVVCLVTGASRGIGKGIALELGSQGAIVYITGTTTTTTKSKSLSNDASVLEEDEETIERTAFEIQQLGGIGIPIRCDHSNDTDVYNVIRQIENDYGYLHILVNNAFRFPTVSTSLSSNDEHSMETNATSTMEFLLRRKFWQQGALAWDTIHTVGLRSHYITTCAAIKLLFHSRQQRISSPTSMISRPLIVMISSFGGLTYSFNVAYGVGKAGVDRMVKDMAYELASEDICVVSLWPGVVNTERTKRSVRDGDWDRYVQLSLDLSETPQFTGRAIVALATDFQNIQKSGSVQVVAELATEYDFTDIDGRSVPPSIRSLRFLLYNYLIQTNPILQNRIPYQWIPDIRIPFWLLVMAQGGPPPSSDSE